MLAQIFSQIPDSPLIFRGRLTLSECTNNHVMIADHNLTKQHTKYGMRGVQSLISTGLWGCTYVERKMPHAQPVACAIYAQGYARHLVINIQALVCSQSFAHCTCTEMPSLGVGKYIFKNRLSEKVNSVAFDPKRLFQASNPHSPSLLLYFILVYAILLNLGLLPAKEFRYPDKIPSTWSGQDEGKRRLEKGEGRRGLKGFAFVGFIIIIIVIIIIILKNCFRSVKLKHWVNVFEPNNHCRISFQVKIWFQNKRSKFKKLLKQGSNPHESDPLPGSAALSPRSPALPPVWDVSASAKGVSMPPNSYMPGYSHWYSSPHQDTMQRPQMM